MRELAILTFITLDGVMDFENGGWATAYWDEVMAQVREEAMAEPYDVLLGRKTYEIFAQRFSSAGDDDTEAVRLNAATKHVATNTLQGLDWHNSLPITGDVAAGIKRLKAQDGRLLQVHGSWQLIQTLFAHDLIDEFRLWTFPVIVGSGKRLFGDTAAQIGLKLVRSSVTPGGVVMGIYRRADAQP